AAAPRPLRDPPVGRRRRPRRLRLPRDRSCEADAAMMGGHMSNGSTVRCERDGAVTIVTIDRPEVRNAVDGPTAAALADAFRHFDADDSSPVAVLTGANGTFCAGADLKGGS